MRDKTRPGLEFEFALIPAGKFSMGITPVGLKDGPQHEVNVSTFFMQTKEVTKAQWDKVREWALKHGYTDLPRGEGKALDHPVQTVTWYAVVKWCNARSEMEGFAPCYYTDASQTEVYRTGDRDLASTMVKWNSIGYRLPTEAEWEKAARGGLADKLFPWGDTISHRDANFDNSGCEDYQWGSTGPHPTYEVGGYPYTAPVGSFAANGYDLYDLAGNVYEWCWDWYGDYPAALETDPRGAAEGSFRVYRGGNWFDNAFYCRVARRNFRHPPMKFNDLGFRPVRSVVP